ncbi:ParB N-terminal domain-containing protein [Sinorhizobium sp. CCBAU 05631]|uniref:ParB N-terminal domain-containing protein n=1 Tax=Sinorhizobium sp. CCBAU 05631 TaxID=794846 RepID=UPI0004B94B40|nr:ParB N-terminal domain-containing protein [Sinorhizobium sp. CCBAU 05631]
MTNETRTFQMDAQVDQGGETLPTDIHKQPFAPALEALRRVEKKTEQVEVEPTHLAQRDLKELTQVFQIRDTTVNERHVSDLVKLLSIHGTIDPIRVWRCGGAVIVIDGHHRLEAFRRWNRRAPVPVKFFKGTVDDAIRFAETANNQINLQLTYQERADYAWKLVVHADELGKLSKAQLIARTTISKGTIDTMRKAARELGVRARQIRSWYEAHQEWKHGQGEDDREYNSSWQEAEAMKMVDRLGDEFGKMLAKRPEITAKAFRHILGRMTPDVAVRMLEEYGLQVTLRDQDGNEVDDPEDFEPQQPSDPDMDLPF